MSEGVEVVISADDQATEVVDNVADNIDARVKRIKEVGGRAKASTEFIGTLASTLGGSELASYAGGIAQLTERISAFSEVSKGGGAGALAFKAGLLGVAAVAGYKIGTMIGDWAFETEKWTKQLAAANDLLRASGTALNQIEAVKLNFRVEKAELGGEVEQRKLLNQLINETAAVEQKIQETKAEQLKDNEGIVGYARYFAGNAEIIAEANKAELDVHQQKLDLLNQEKNALIAKLSPQRDEIETLKQAQALKERNRSYIEGLQNEVALLKASKEERAAIEAGQRAGGDTESALRIESLLREKQAIEEKQEAEKAAEEERKKADEDAKKRAEEIEKIKQNEVKRLKEQEILLNQGKEAARAFALEQQGLDEATAKRLAAEQERIDKMASRQQDPGTQQAVQGRLLTRGTQDRTKELIDVNKEIKKVLEGIEKNTEWRSQSELKLEVVGK